MAKILIPKKKFTKEFRKTLTSALYEHTLVNQEGLKLEDALTLPGEPIEHGEEEIESIVDEVIFQLSLELDNYER
jgi:hypothetical protein